MKMAKKVSPARARIESRACAMESARARSRTAGSGPAGITGVVLLAESHLAVHTWPELGAVTLDVYVCNFGADNSAKAEGLMQALLAAWQPASVDRQRLQRGRGLPPSA